MPGKALVRSADGLLVDAGPGEEARALLLNYSDTMNANIDPSATNPSNGKRRRILLLIALIFIVIGALWAAYWVLVLEKREKTDDAYVNGNRVVISAQVSGTVVAVLADEPRPAPIG